MVMNRIYGLSSVGKTQNQKPQNLLYKEIAKWVNSEKPDSQKIQSEFEDFCQKENINLVELRPVFNKLFKIYISISNYSEKGCSACRMGSFRDLLEISSRKLNADENELAGAAKLYTNYKKFHKDLIKKNNAAIKERKIDPRHIRGDRSEILKLMRINLDRLAKNFRDDNLNKFVTNVSNWILDDDKRGKLLAKLRKIDSKRRIKNSTF